MFVEQGVNMYCSPKDFINESKFEWMVDEKCSTIHVSNSQVQLILVKMCIIRRIPVVSLISSSQMCNGVNT